MSLHRFARLAAWAAAACCVLAARPAAAGVVNPDISILGQPFIRWTNDAADPSAKRAVLDVGEVETIFDAYLNPYARGLFNLSLSEDGMELEEGYFTLLRGLPGGLTLKGGKYRGLREMNIMHPHAVPFAERPRILAAYLPETSRWTRSASPLRAYPASRNVLAHGGGGLAAG
jgi:hypothetical protein